MRRHLKRAYLFQRQPNHFTTHALLKWTACHFPLVRTHTTEPLCFRYIGDFCRNVWIMTPLMPRLIAAVTKDNDILQYAVSSIAFYT